MFCENNIDATHVCLIRGLASKWSEFCDTNTYFCHTCVSDTCARVQAVRARSRTGSRKEHDLATAYSGGLQLVESSHGGGGGDNVRDDSPGWSLHTLSHACAHCVTSSLLLTHTIYTARGAPRSPMECQGEIEEEIDVAGSPPQSPPMEVEVENPYDYMR